MARVGALAIIGTTVGSRIMIPASSSRRNRSSSEAACSAATMVSAAMPRKITGSGCTHDGDVDDPPLDAQERQALCDLFDELGAEAPTVLGEWTAKDLAAHLVLREHDFVAGPCLVLPGRFQRFAEKRRVRLAQRREFDWLVAQIRSGPPPGFFRIGWVRSIPNLNEYFVHHEDLRRANDLGPRDFLTTAMEAALWRNVRQGCRHLSRRLHDVGLEIAWAGTDERITIREDPASAVRLRGRPSELLLYLFGRQAMSHVELTGPAESVAAVRRTHFGM